MWDLRDSWNVGDKNINVWKLIYMFALFNYFNIFNLFNCFDLYDYFIYLLFIIFYIISCGISLILFLFSM